MNEFQKLLESELLNEETKKELREAFETIKKEAVLEAKNELEVEYATKLVEEKEELAKKLNDVVAECVAEEIKELKEDIQYYKDIEPKYAKRLEEFKTEYAKTLSESFEKFVSGQVKDEIKELKDDLMEAKNNNFGIKLFEAFKDTFEKLGATDDINKIKTDLENANKQLKESKETIDSMNREKLMETLLNNLSGKKRKVMKTILENVDTDKLEARYQEVISSVIEDKDSKEETLKESTEDKKEKDDKTTINEDLQKELDEIRRLSGNFGKR